MEDISYVSLSLEKYNELYDKAKKFDELKKQFGEKMSDTIDKMANSVIQMLNDIKESEKKKEEK